MKPFSYLNWVCTEITFCIFHMRWSQEMGFNESSSCLPWLAEKPDYVSYYNMLQSSLIQFSLSLVILLSPDLFWFWVMTWTVTCTHIHEHKWYKFHQENTNARLWKSAYYSICCDSIVQGNQLHMCRPDLTSNSKLNNMTAAWVYVHKQVLSSYPLILKIGWWVHRVLCLPLLSK